MRAKYCLLTHFSQRYPKMPELGAQKEGGSLVAISFDSMSLRLRDMWKTKAWMPAMTELFAELEVAEPSVDGDAQADVIPAKGQSKKKVKQKAGKAAAA